MPEPTPRQVEIYDCFDKISTAYPNADTDSLLAMTADKIACSFNEAAGALQAYTLPPTATDCRPRDLLEMHMDVGEITFANGSPVLDEAIIYFPELFDSPKIIVKAPRAHHLADRMAKLWNAATDDDDEQSDFT